MNILIATQASIRPHPLAASPFLTKPTSLALLPCSLGEAVGLACPEGIGGEGWGVACFP